MFDRIDKPLLFVILALSLFGLVMISSVSGSFEVTEKNDFYFWKHFWYLVFSLPVFLFFLTFPPEKLHNLSGLFFVFCVLLLFLTVIMGEDYGTAAKLWLKIGFLPSFQPVEIMKLALIIFLSALFSSGKLEVDSLQGGFIPFAVVLGIPSLFLIIQSDFGSLFILTLIAAVLYFVAGANIKHLLGGGIIALLGGIIVIFTTPYILYRIKVFFNPDLDPLNTGFQVKQALIAIGSGGLWGRGFQNSIQKFDYLPEVQSDTIFSAIAEEMGFFRILLLLSAYLFIAYRGFFIAKNVSSVFLKYLAVGITTFIVGQAFINIGVNLALFPNTGITLPFISYGGTSLIVSFICFGILLRISAEVSEKKRRSYYRL